MKSKVKSLRSGRRQRSSGKGNKKDASTVSTPQSPTPFYLLPSFRLLLVWAVLVTGCLGLIANLYKLQILQTLELKQKARQQQTITVRPFTPRRPIVDRNGNVLATDRPVFTLFAHPKLFKSSNQEIANKLAEILVRTPDEVLAQLNKGKSGIRITDSVTEEQADSINKLRTDGLELIESNSRFYPAQDIDADVVGYVDKEHRGQAGVEFSQESLLQRANRTIRLSRTAEGAFMPDRMPEGFLHLDDLQLKLTLDTRLQRAVRTAVKTKMQEIAAKRVAVIVMDVHDGSIVSLLTEPTYDPNNYSKYDLKTFKNWAVSDLYEPGSTFKPINVAIALEAGVITPNSTFFDGGYITVGGWRIKNAEPGGGGNMSIAQILQHSSNIGMVQIIQRMKPDIYYSWLERIGLWQTAGIDLPFEAKAMAKNRQRFIGSAIEPAVTAFGQGVSLTPIHLVQLHAAIANGGKLVTPHVVKGLVDSQGQMFWQPHLPEPRQIFSQKTSQAVLEMMETVVTKGTGKPAQVPGYRIAGKTGTAQKAGDRGYKSGAFITSFVGIVPVESPRYVVLCVVDEATKGVIFGSTTAAPIVKSVLEALLTFEGIPPSMPIETEKK